MRSPHEVQQQFEIALDLLLQRVRREPTILAVILCGSMSHDKVWEKSDMDVIIVGRDEKGAQYGKKDVSSGFALLENNVNIHAMYISRAAFKKLIEGNLQSSFMHSLLAKGTIVYTKDETIRDLYENITRIGSRDREIQLLASATRVLPVLYKAEKWFHAKRDYPYAAHWILYCVDSLARVEVTLEGELCGREVIQQALRINPAFFHAIYTDFQNEKKTEKSVGRVLEQIDNYLLKKKKTLFAPLLAYLQEQDAPRSATEIETHFTNNFGISMMTTACEWLADKGVLLQLSAPVRLTPKGRVDFEEMAFAIEADH
jgi:predicted nucleotidyltransferase